MQNILSRIKSSSTGAPSPPRFWRPSAATSTMWSSRATPGAGWSARCRCWRASRPRSRRASTAIFRC